MLSQIASFISHNSIMALKFNKYVLDAEAFIKEIAQEMGAPIDMNRAERILRAVLHAFRNRLRDLGSIGSGIHANRGNVLREFRC